MKDRPCVWAGEHVSTVSFHTAGHRTVWLT